MRLLHRKKEKYIYKKRVSLISSVGPKYTNRPEKRAINKKSRSPMLPFIVRYYLKSLLSIFWGTYNLIPGLMIRSIHSVFAAYPQDLEGKSQKR
jgi:hypothetical protein